MAPYKITLIHGDGIGPEVVDATVRCVEAICDTHGFSIEWDQQQAGENALLERGSLLPKKTLDSIKKNGVALKGPLTTPIGKGFRSINVELRQNLDLFANVRPARTFLGTRSRYQGVDLVVIRENTEDLYAGIEFEKGANDTKKLIEFILQKQKKVIRSDSAISIKPISTFGSKRIAQFAFEYAKRNRRRKVTAVHKANIMKFSDGLFLRTAEDVSRKYKSVRFESKIVDDMCMQLVVKPQEYDVLLCPNLYGDILSDLCAGLAGGLGMAPGGNIGRKVAVFEPVHGSSPKHAGKNEVNPTACILAAAMMLEHIGKLQASKDLKEAVAEVIKDGKKVTYDLAVGKPVGTSEMAGAIVKRINGM